MFGTVLQINDHQVIFIHKYNIVFKKKNHDIFVDLNLILRVHMYIVYIIFSYNDAFNHGYISTC